MAVSVTSEKVTATELRKSESSEDNEMDMYIVTQEDDRETEVNFGKEIPNRNESPQIFHIGGEENKLTSLIDISRRENNNLKLSVSNTERLEKIIQQSDDDKIANVLNVVDDLKTTFHGLKEVKIQTRLSNGLSTNSKSNLHIAATFNSPEKEREKKGIKLELAKPMKADRYEFGKLFEELREFGLAINK